MSCSAVPKVFQMSRLKEKLKEHYDDQGDGWYTDIDSEPSKYYYSTFFKNLFKPNLSGNNAADLGCGGGIYTFQLSKYPFSKVYALDFSEKMLFFLDKRGGKH